MGEGGEPCPASDVISLRLTRLKFEANRDCDIANNTSRTSYLLGTFAMEKKVRKRGFVFEVQPRHLSAVLKCKLPNKLP